jgi:hypothetical protein
MKDLNFDGKVTISDYSIFIFEPYNRFLKYISDSDLGVFFELSNDGFLNNLILLVFIGIGISIVIVLALYVLLFLAASIYFLSEKFLIFPKKFLRLPKKVASSKSYIFFSQFGFINNVLFGFVVFLFISVIIGSMGY